jgi:hypothetical protein
MASVARCCVVKRAGIVPTGTMGMGAAGATGTKIRRVVTTPVPVRVASASHVGPAIVVTHAWGHWSAIMRADSGIADP